MKYRFKVQGKPPKKDGANSMWNKDSEIPQLIELRKQAYEVFKEEKKVLSKNISLKVEIFLTKNSQNIGDLDNFITGICDGLMKAHGNAKTEKYDQEAADEIKSHKFNLIEDDYKITQINAKKNVSPELKSEHYIVEIEEK